VQRAEQNELLVDYVTDPTTTTGFLEVTATPGNVSLIPLVLEDAKERLRAHGPQRWGKVIDCVGFKASITFGKTLTQGDTFAYNEGEVKVRFYLEAQAPVKKTTEQDNEELLKEAWGKAVVKMVDDQTALPKKRGRTRAGDADERRAKASRVDGNGDTDEAMNGAAAAPAGTDATAVAVSVSSSDAEDTATAEEKEAALVAARELADQRLAEVKKPIRVWMARLSECRYTKEARQFALEHVTRLIPATAEEAKTFGEDLASLVNPGDLAAMMSKYSKGPQSLNALSIAAWVNHLLHTPTAPTAKALNVIRSSHTVKTQKSTPPSTSNTDKRTKPGRRSRSGQRPQ